jgi:hypothetical protein
MTIAVPVHHMTEAELDGLPIALLACLRLPA